MGRCDVKVTEFACPECSCPLQRLEPSASWPAKALEYAAGFGIQLPPLSPAAAVAAHTMIVHDDLDLGDVLGEFSTQWRKK